MRAHLPYVCLLIGGVSACLPPEDLEPSTENSQSLNGTVVFTDSSCPLGTVQTKITQAMTAAANQLGSMEMADCLRQAVLSYTDDAYAEEVLAIMRQNMPTNVSCGTLAPNTLAEAAVGISNESIKFSTGFVLNASVPNITDVILHEVAHNKGYDHSTQANASPTLDNIATAEYAHTINEQLQQCSVSISAGDNPLRPQGPRRDSLTQETLLAPVGRSGGSPFETKCPGGSLAMGISMRSGIALDAIGLDCRVPSLSTITRTGMAGGGGGSPRTLDCIASEVLVGLNGRANSTLVALGPICAPEPEVRRRGLFAFEDPIVGVAGGVDFQRRCPAGMGIRAIKGRVGSLVDRLELECQSIDRLETLEEEFLQIQGGQGGKDAYEKCAGRSAMVGLTYHSSNRVNRIGALCQEVSTSAGVDRLMNVPLHLMAAHGGTDGTVAEERCPAGSVLVGLDIRMGAEVDAVAGRCAVAADWSDGHTTTSTALPMHGGGGGSLVTRNCIQGEFMIGWRMRTGQRVDMVSPVCRNFR